MSTFASVSVNDNLTACQTSIAVGASDDEFTCGVHEVFDIEPEQIKHLLGVYLLLYPWNQDVHHVVFDSGEHPLVVGVELIVLCRYDNGVDALGDAFFAVLDCYLTLGVGAQISHLLAFLADIRKCAHNKVGQIKTHRHIVLGLVSGIAEHHTLVAGTLLFFVAVIHAAVDVLALFVDGTQDTA